jgi:AcrR family transcriptional regulator
MERDRRKRAGGAVARRKGRGAGAGAATAADAATGGAARQAARQRREAAPRDSRAGERKPRMEPAARRQAILDAALVVFAEHGFEAARLDEVAARAGVAKGTLYLYFKDKQALFETLVRSAIDPVFERLAAVSAVPDLPLGQVLQLLFAVFRSQILETDRKLMLRLVIAEGPRFPAIAEFHYRNVVARMLPLIRRIAERAVERGELPNDALVRFPQLVAGPLLLAVLWDAMFTRIDPLDVGRYLEAFGDMLTAGARSPAP